MKNLLASVSDKVTSSDGLGILFEFRRNLSNLDGVYEFVVPAAGHRYGNRHYREFYLLTLTGFPLDITAVAILSVVKIRNHLIERFNNGITNSFKTVRGTDDHKVITADMPYKILFSATDRDSFINKAGCCLYDLTPFCISVAVAECLEVVQIYQAECQRCR